MYSRRLSSVCAIVPRHNCTPTTPRASIIFPHLASRPLSYTASHYKARRHELPPRPTLPDADIKHVYLKGSGPGGQKINKTSSAVQLTHIPTGIVVKSQATRSQSQNHTIARRLLAEKIELLEKGSESRVAKKIERDRRKKASSSKKARRKYRKLAGEDGNASVMGTGMAVVAGSAMQGSVSVIEEEGEEFEEWNDDENDDMEEDEEGIENVSRVEILDEDAERLHKDLPKE